MNPPALALPPSPSPEQEGWLFYHALYYKLTHWAASLTILVWLLTLGILLSTRQTGTLNHLHTSASVICFLWLTEGYLSIRIMKLGGYIRRKLSPWIKETEGWTFLCWAPFISATLATVWDLRILYHG